MLSRTLFRSIPINSFSRRVRHSTSTTTTSNPLDPTLRLLPITELYRTHQTPTSPSLPNPTSIQITQSQTTDSSTGSSYTLSIPLPLSINKDSTTNLTNLSLTLFDSSFLLLQGPHFTREFSLSHPIASPSHISCRFHKGENRVDISVFRKLDWVQENQVDIPVQVVD